MLLSDADIVEPVGMTRSELDEAGAVGHRGGDGDDLAVMVGKGGQGLAEDLGVGRGGDGGGLSRLSRVLAEAVEFVGLCHRGGVAAPLLSDDVQDDGLFLGLEELKGADKERDVVAVDRPEVAQPEILKNDTGQKDLLHARLDLVGKVARSLAADPLDELSRLLMKVGVGGTGGDPVEMLGNGAGVFGNRPLVVVQDDDEPLRGLSDVVECLVAHAAGEGGVAGDGDHMFLPRVHVASGGHPEGGGEGGSGVTGPVAVVLALAAQKEAVEPAVLAHGGEAVAATRQDLVNVSLMTDVEEDLVRGGVEDSVKGDGELDDAEVRTKVTARLGKRADQLLADLPRKARQVGLGEFLEICGAVDPVEQAPWGLPAHDFSNGSRAASPRLLRVMISIRFSAASSFSRQTWSSFIPSS